MRLTAWTSGLLLFLAGWVFGSFVTYLRHPSVFIMSQHLELANSSSSPKPPPVKQFLTVGVLITACGKYIKYIEKLIKTARQQLFAEEAKMGHAPKVTYYLFTDRGEDTKAFRGDDLVVIHQDRQGWPNDSMMRPANYLRAVESKQVVR